MAVDIAKINSLASLVNMFAGSDPVKAQIIPLDEDGFEQEEFARAFQYFPENVSDSKGANYSSKNIPGGSHPLYQFINGTDRTISFTAIFTSDENPASPSLLGVLRGGLDVSLADVAGVLGNVVGADTSGLKKHSVPVDSAVIWLRSFMYPRYTKSDGNPLGTVAPPPVARLYLPNSGIHGATPNGQLVVDSIDCLMTQCDVVYDAFYRNGEQRITTVSLTFNETIQTGAENWQFADGEILARSWQSDDFGKTPAYPLKTKGSQPDTKADRNFLNRAKTALNTSLSNVSNLV